MKYRLLLVPIIILLLTWLVVDALYLNSDTSDTSSRTDSTGISEPSLKEKKFPKTYLMTGPGLRISIHRDGEAAPNENVLELLRKLGDDSGSVKANIEKYNGVVRRLRIKNNRSDNIYKKSSGTHLERADRFLEDYKGLFLLDGRTLNESKLYPTDKSSINKKEISVIKYQQTVDGIEVLLGRISVHMNDTGITRVRANLKTIPKELSLTPTISAGEAESILIKDWGYKKYKMTSQLALSQELKLLTPSSYMRTNIRTTTLVWQFDTGFQTLWMNAHTGVILTSHSNLRF